MGMDFLARYSEKVASPLQGILVPELIWSQLNSRHRLTILPLRNRESANAQAIPASAVPGLQSRASPGHRSTRPRQAVHIQYSRPEPMHCGIIRMPQDCRIDSMLKT